MTLLLGLFARAAISLRRQWSGDFSNLLRELRETSVPAISEHLENALIAAEDHRFLNHYGVDLFAIVRATIRTVIFGKLEGASTIEQQLVRVTTCRFEITFRRKLREIIYALALRRHFGKREILRLYLARGYYGSGMSNLIGASQKLNIEPASATILDAAHIVARLRYPESQSSSEEQRRRLDRRVDYILRLCDKEPGRISTGAIVSEGRQA